MYRPFNTRSDKDRVRSWYMNLPRSPDIETFGLCKLFLTFITLRSPKAKHREIWKNFPLPYRIIAHNKIYHDDSTFDIMRGLLIFKVEISKNPNPRSI